MCSGQAAFDAGSLKRKYRAQAAFALSCHSGFDALVEYVRATGPDRVLLHRGRVDQCTAALRELGIDAAPLTGPEQLSLV